MSDSEETTEKLGRVARLKRWLFANPLLSGVGLLACAGALAIGLTFFGGEAEKKEIEASVDQMLLSLEGGDYETARAMAIEVSKKPGVSFGRGSSSFVLGRLLVHETCEPERREDRRRGLYLIASKYFDEADLQGVPLDLQSDVSYWWGKTLFLAGEKIAAREPLKSALDAKHPNQIEILEYLALIHLDDPKASKAEGVVFTDRMLEEPNLTDEERNRAKSLKTKLLLQNEQLTEAAEVYDTLTDDARGADSIYAELGRARLREAARLEVLRRPSEEIKAVYQKAVEAFERDVAQAEFGSDLERATRRYQMGQALKGAGKLNEANQKFGYVRQQYFDQPIGIAAGFWEAQCLLELESFDEAESRYASVLRETVRANNQGETEWLNQKSIPEMVRRGVDHYLRLENYAAAVQLADQLRQASVLREPPIPLSHAAELKSTSLKSWITRLEEQKAISTFRDRPTLEKILKEKYNEYGHSMYSLAINRYASAKYATDLYEAGEAFYRSGDYRRATLAFRKYLDTNDDTQAAQTRLRIGQSLLAERNFAEALEPLASCWTLYPNDPIIYQARFQAAQCYLELSNPDKAQEMLRANLDNDALTPQSQEWIRSLFLLGNLLFEEGLKLEAKANSITNLAANDTNNDPTQLLEQANEFYSRAIQRLNEAVQRAPELPAANLGRYHLAESYRRSNVWRELQLSRTTVVASQVDLTRSIKRANEKAIEHFEALETQLLRIRETRPLEPNEEALLRNSYFSRGNLLFQLNRFEEAISMYRSASNMVIQKPEVLEAYVQIASCYRKLSRHDEANRIINQAKILLRDRIPQDADFEATTRFNRDRWVALLDWLTTI